AKADLATMFVSRCLALCESGGSSALVTPQNWLFLSSYKKLRGRLLKRSALNYVVRLGPAAFQDMNWWAANTAFFVSTNAQPPDNHLFNSLDASSTRVTSEKPQLLCSQVLATLKQADQLKNPDLRIALGEDFEGVLLAKYAISMRGIVSGDGDR